MCLHVRACVCVCFVGIFLLFLQLTVALSLSLLLRTRVWWQVSVEYLPQLFSKRPPLTRQQLLDELETQVTQALRLHAEPANAVFRTQLAGMVRTHLYLGGGP